ncbi:MAG: hypothetical protein ABJO67_16230 [Pseudoruegeria sp.]
MMTPAEIEALFTRRDGQYAFARWGRPIAPVIFGVQEETLNTIKGAIEAVVSLAGHSIAETDPELGANLMVFFIQDWEELSETPNLDRLIPELGGLVARLQTADANQYRIFRFDDQGAIQACFVFLRMDNAMLEIPADVLSLSQMVQSVLLWSDTAFGKESPLAVLPETGATILRPEIAAVVQAAYADVLPSSATDPAHALRIFARLPREN